MMRKTGARQQDRRFVLTGQSLAMTPRPEARNGRDIASDLYSDSAMQALESGAFEQAERLFKLAFFAVKGSQPPDEREAKALQDLATVSALQEKWERAESLGQQALSLWETLYGPAHLLSTPCLVSLSQVYQGRQRFADAASLLQQALQIRE